MGRGSSVFGVGKTVSASTVLCTRMSTAFVWRSPATVSVVRPGATAVTTPVRLTRATPGSTADHCRASGLTNRLPCAGTTTCSVSTSPGDMTGEGVDAGGSGCRRPSRRLRGSSGGGRGGGAHYLHRGLALPRARPRLDDRYAASHARHRPVVVHPRHRDIVGRPDDAHGGDDVTGAVERGGEQSAPLPDLDRDRRGSHLDFRDILCRRRARNAEEGEEQDTPSRHSGAKVSAPKYRCQANLSRSTGHRPSGDGLGRIHLRGSIPG